MFIIIYTVNNEIITFLNKQMLLTKIFQIFQTKRNPKKTFAYFQGRGGMQQTVLEFEV